MPKQQTSSVTAAQWTFYVSYIVFLFIEAGIIKFLASDVATWCGLGAHGAWFAGVVFALGAALLALLEMYLTKPGETLKGPLLRGARWLILNWGVGGFILATIAFGTLAVGEVLESEELPNRRGLALLSGVWFSCFWVPLVLTVWKSA